MKRIELTAEEAQELRAAHKSMKNKKSAYKINAILLLDTGMTPEEVSEVLLLDDQTIRNYSERYINSGLEGLLATDYKGRPPKLTNEEETKLCEMLDEQIYPTTKSICELVWSEFKKRYTVSGMTDLLHRLGYVYKKPKLVPGNPDDEAQEAFVKQFNEFMEEKADNEAVIFMDAVHPTHNVIAASGWIRRGEEKELKTNTGRQRLNIHGGINVETHDIITLSSESNINAEATIQFLQYLESVYPAAAKIYCICDNAKYHFCNVVSEYLKNSKVVLIPLPSYSPELNLIERVWGFFEKTVLHNRYYKTFNEFRNACDNFFCNQKAYEKEIDSLIGDGLLAYF